MSGNRNAVAAERFGLRVTERARAMVENRREIYERFTILLAMNLIVGGAYSPGTPIDKGFARNSWAVARGGAAPRFRQASHPSAQFSTAGGRVRNVTTGQFASHSAIGGAVNVVSFVEAVAALRGIKLGEEVRFVSNCVYIRRLEFGHSGQAPGGFYRITVAAAPRIAKDASAQVGATKSAGRELLALRNG